MNRITKRKVCLKIPTEMYGPHEPNFRMKSTALLVYGPNLPTREERLGSLKLRWCYSQWWRSVAYEHNFVEGFYLRSCIACGLAYGHNKEVTLKWLCHVCEEDESVHPGTVPDW